MTGQRMNLLGWIVVALVAMWITAQIIVSVAKSLNNREAHQEAEAWFQEAQKGAKRDMTADDAVRWLKENGAGTVYKGERKWINEREMENHTVGGFRTVSEESLWTEPRTAELVFEFDSEWHFKEVKMAILKYTIHGIQAFAIH